MGVAVERVESVVYKLNDGKESESETVRSGPFASVPRHNEQLNSRKDNVIKIIQRGNITIWNPTLLYVNEMNAVQSRAFPMLDNAAPRPPKPPQNCCRLARINPAAIRPFLS